MTRKISFGIASAITLLALSALVSQAQMQQQPPGAPGAAPAAIVGQAVTVTETVQSVDAAKRTVTLQGPAGNQWNFKVGPNVNLANLKPGDDVTARYTQAVAIRVEKPQATEGQAMPAAGHEPGAGQK